MKSIFFISLMVVGLRSQCGVVLDPLCSSCAGLCGRCVASFLNITNPLTSFCQKPANYVAKCATYDSSSNCIACGPGFYLANATSCQALPTGCQEGTNATFCTSCSNNLVPNGGNCTSSTVNCTTTNCMVCGSGSLCRGCKSGFMLNEQFACVAVPTGNPGCAVSVLGACFGCADGYYQNNQTICVANAAASFNALSAGVFGTLLAVLGAIMLN